MTTTPAHDQSTQAASAEGSVRPRWLAPADDIIPWDRFVELSVIDSAHQDAAACAVCRDQVPAGQGVTARYEGRTLRFRCQGCLGRFAEDPARFLAGQREQWCSYGQSESAAVDP